MGTAFHVNNKGEAKICGAKTPSSCRFLEGLHGESPAEALLKYEVSMKSSEIQATVSKSLGDSRYEDVPRKLDFPEGSKVRFYATNSPQYLAKVQGFIEKGFTKALKKNPHLPVHKKIDDGTTYDFGVPTISYYPKLQKYYYGVHIEGSFRARKESDNLSSVIVYASENSGHGDEKES